jgi:NAD(P)-dependent dehydrogenase (short-subunit alcohol dehydrogenase family)
MSSLLGKLALVTGGSGTIGKAIAKALASRGAQVVITGRNLDRLEQAASSIQTKVPSASPIKCISCDVTVESSVTELFQTLDNIQLLVNNAGTAVDGATVDLTADDFERVMRVNVTGPFLCAREAMKRMKHGGGRIINIGSLSAISPRPHSAPYTTSKFALAGLSQSLALDGRPYGISVGIIHPGNVESELLSKETIAERELEGFLQPQQVADCVVSMANMPASANVLEMTIMPTPQPLVGRG